MAAKAVIMPLIILWDDNLSYFYLKKSVIIISNFYKLINTKPENGELPVKYKYKYFCRIDSYIRLAMYK